MAKTRYALTVVFDIDFVTEPRDEGFGNHFTTVAKDAISNYSTRSVSGTDVVFVSVSRDASSEQE